MNRLEESDYIDYSDLKELSYLDDGGANTYLFVNGLYVGLIEVWTDREGEQDREYICLNHSIVYLDTLSSH